jgi:hypothetical protein
MIEGAVVDPMLCSRLLVPAWTGVVSTIAASVMVTLHTTLTDLLLAESEIS